MPNEADTCRRYVFPQLPDAGWETEPHSLTEQKTVTNGRVIVAAANECGPNAAQNHRQGNGLEPLFGPRPPAVTAKNEVGVPPQCRPRRVGSVLLYSRPFAC